MISQNKIKKINHLKTKKGRTKEKLYIIEGIRCVKSYIDNSASVKEVFFTRSFISTDNNIIELCDKNKIAYSIISEIEMKQLSDTITPSGVFGICKLKNKHSLDLNSNRWIYLYKISDGERASCSLAKRAIYQ